ncbi:MULTISPECIES: hypothetical protein [unclassified Veillonella]|uniref:hypothetical protein n=1 Tax=unclassified Veillonella TaxID=2630086 RepID=UPI000F8C610E|nr:MULTISPECIES: hypothetical protein [unclassified Veillonella]
MNWKCVMASVALVGTMLSGHAASIILDGQGSVELPSHISVVNHDDLIDGGLKKEDVVHKTGPNAWHLTEQDAKVLDGIIKAVVQRGQRYQLQGRDERGLHTAELVHLHMTGAEAAEVWKIRYKDTMMAPQSVGETLYSKTVKELQKIDLYNVNVMRGKRIEKNGSILVPYVTSTNHEFSDTAIMQAVLPLVNVRFLDGEMMKPVHIKGDKGLYTHGRVQLDVDGFVLPAYMSFVGRYGQEGLSMTLITTADTSKAYWNPVIMSLLGMKGE